MLLARQMPKRRDSASSENYALAVNECVLSSERTDSWTQQRDRTVAPEEGSTSVFNGAAREMWAAPL